MKKKNMVNVKLYPVHIAVKRRKNLWCFGNLKNDTFFSPGRSRKHTKQDPPEVSTNGPKNKSYLGVCQNEIIQKPLNVSVLKPMHIFFQEREIFPQQVSKERKTEGDLEIGDSQA